MASPSIQDLQTRVNEIVANSDSDTQAIKAAQNDETARGLLNEILVDAVAKAWTRREAAEISAFMAQIV